jgi:hypothetical protein
MNDPKNSSDEPGHEDSKVEAQDKVEHPLAHFENPADVVVDAGLTKDDKVRALETMEQDARQMAVAAGEGMAGGEAARLDDVLAAKDALELPPFDLAVTVVVQGLRAKLPLFEGTETHTTIAGAIRGARSGIRSDQASCRRRLNLTWRHPGPGRQRPDERGPSLAGC